MNRDTIHVVVTCHNAARWVARSVESIAGQSWPALSCVVVNDASTDATKDRIRRAVRGDRRFQVVNLPRRMWPAAARMTALNHLDNARPWETVVLVDGDDWLCDRDALAVIHDAHHARGLLAAYGGTVHAHGAQPRRGEYPLWVMLTGTFRRCPWFAAHVRSFRFGLWSYVRPDALRDCRGRFYRAATDQAFFFPILELAGTRSGAIHQPLYMYNPPTPGTRDPRYIQAQRRAAAGICRRTPYAALPAAAIAGLLSDGGASR